MGNAERRGWEVKSGARSWGNWRYNFTLQTRGAPEGVCAMEWWCPGCVWEEPVRAAWGIGWRKRDSTQEIHAIGAREEEPRKC